MLYENITLQTDEGEILLSLNRPKALNALNRATFAELRHFFGTDYQQYEPFAGVILTGSGEKAFAAGADIKEFENLNSESASELSRSGQEVFEMIENFHRPVIAAVNGFSLGGGCELAMACHIRIASDRARFGQPEVNLGIVPGYGGTQRLPRYVGKSKAMELLLTGDMIDASEALALGLVSRVVPGEELLDTCRKLLKKISSKGPLAVSKIIDCVNAYYLDGVDGFGKEVREFGILAESEDFKEGAQAFVEKRRAEFKGR